MTDDKERQPYGGLPYTGNKWRESIEHRRLFVGNPHASERLIQILGGLRSFVSDDRTCPHSHGDRPITPTDRQRIVTALDVVIEGIDLIHPEWREDGFMPDSDFGLGRHRPAQDVLDFVNELTGHAKS